MLEYTISLVEDKLVIPMGQVLTNNEEYQQFSFQENSL
jgi:hypothetical protein